MDAGRSPLFCDAALAARIERAEAQLMAAGALVQVELAHVGDPDIGALLTARGYRLRRSRTSSGAP